MKFLLDQSTDGRLAVYLRKLGHDVTRIAADYPAGLLDPRTSPKIPLSAMDLM
jgi:streptomycin 6-kinase